MMVPRIGHIALCWMAFAVPFLCYGQDLESRNERKDSLEKEIDLINRQLSENKSRQTTDLNTLSLLQKKIGNRKLLISDMDRTIAGYRSSILKKEKQIGKLNTRLDTLTAYYDRLIYSTYKNRDTKIWFMYLLSSENISQAIRRWSYLKNISSAVKVQASEIKSTRTALTEEKKNLNHLLHKEDEQQKLRKEEYELLTEEETSINKSLTDLSKQEKSIRKKLAAKKNEVERINRELERIIAEAVKKSNKEETATSENTSSLTGNFENNKGRIPFPVHNGIIVEHYGQSYHPVFKTVKLPFNNGINISAPKGAKAISVYDGIVKQIIVIPGYNQCVLIQHGKYYTFYCKLKDTSVKAGQKVATGNEIGTIETSPDGLTILHFELWNGTAKQDPELWLKN